MHRTHWTHRLLLAAVWVAAPGAAHAQEGPERSWHAGPMVVWLSRATVSSPSATSWVQYENSSSTAFGVRAGVLIMHDRVGWGLDAFHYRAEHPSFALPYSADSPELVGSGDLTVYADPRVAVSGAEGSLHWRPRPGVPVDLVGLVAVAVESHKFRLSGAQLPEWNGARRRSNTSFGFGVGARWLAWRHAAVSAEARLLTTSAGFACRLGDEAGPGLRACADRRDIGTVQPRVFSVGASYVF